MLPVLRLRSIPAVGNVAPPRLAVALAVAAGTVTARVPDPAAAMRALAAMVLALPRRAAADPGAVARAAAVRVPVARAPAMVPVVARAVVAAMAAAVRVLADLA